MGSQVIVQNLIILQVASRNQDVIFRAVTSPPNEIFEITVSCTLVVNDFLHEILW